MFNSLASRAVLGLTISTLSLGLGGSFAMAQGTPAAAAATPAAAITYSAAQARRGSTAYRDNCSACHGDSLDGALDAPALKGSAFQANWFGKSAGELYTFMSTNMPQDRPGELQPKQYADIFAFLLKSNAVAAGPDNTPDLTADTIAAASMPAAK